MATEKSKMLAGEFYLAMDSELLADRQRTQDLCRQFNGFTASDAPGRRSLLKALLASGSDATITAPFFCDYGYNIHLGANVYFNFNCVILDGMPVTVGANCLFGPGVHIYTAMHPLSASERRNGLEFAKAVTIGDDVWVGGGAIICPGVHIGDGAVIGAGSVVTRDVPAGMFAAGNPCRVLRPAVG